MGKWFESFTLYDLFGYFSVGVLSILGFDLVWHWPGVSLPQAVRSFNIYAAFVAVIPAYVLGQVLGTLSKFLAQMLKWRRVKCLLEIRWIEWLLGANPPDWKSLRPRIVGVEHESCVGDSDEAVWWLAQDFCRVRAPSAYADLFKLLAYSGAARSLCLVSLVLSVVSAFRWAWHRSIPLWVGLCGLVLSVVFYVTFIRIFRQYRQEMINTALVLLADQTSSKSIV